ncbi:MAG: DUF4416 family protein [Candidatus Omnitrophota bacterium]
MGKIRDSHPAKLIIGLIFRNEQVFNKAKTLLEKQFGKADFISPAFPFTHTDYYKAEFGSDLKRRFLSFKKLIGPHQLPRIKLKANSIEKKLSKGGRRLINIDPGYLDMAKLILASTKDYCHRIYLDKGIYAETTLIYRDKSFIPCEWTYLDYSSPGYIGIFNSIREIYACQTGIK